MFKVKRFRKIVMKYGKIYSDSPELVRQNPDYYICALQNLIDDIDYELGFSGSIMRTLTIIEIKLHAKSMNIFWKFIQKITDVFYDNTLYSIEELDSFRRIFEKFKSKTEQVKIFHDNF